MNNKSKQMEIQRVQPFIISSSRTERQQRLVCISVSVSLQGLHEYCFKRRQYEELLLFIYFCF